MRRVRPPRISPPLFPSLPSWPRAPSPVARTRVTTPCVANRGRGRRWRAPPPLLFLSLPPIFFSSISFSFFPFLFPLFFFFLFLFSPSLLPFSLLCLAPARPEPRQAGSLPRSLPSRTPPPARPARPPWPRTALRLTTPGRAHARAGTGSPRRAATPPPERARPPSRGVATRARPQAHGLATARPAEPVHARGPRARSTAAPPAAARLPAPAHRRLAARATPLRLAPLARTRARSTGPWANAPGRSDVSSAEPSCAPGRAARRPVLTAAAHVPSSLHNLAARAPLHDARARPSAIKARRAARRAPPTRHRPRPPNRPTSAIKDPTGAAPPHPSLPGRHRLSSQLTAPPPPPFPPAAAGSRRPAPSPRPEPR